MSSRNSSPLRLGLLAGLQPSGSPPIALLLARAGWDTLWLPDVEPGSSTASRDGLRVGVLIDDPERQPVPGEHVWLRRAAAIAVSGSPSTARDWFAAADSVSCDAADVAAAEACTDAGIVPVLGPAPLDDLLERLRHTNGDAAVCLPASPGRTEAEARARLASDAGTETEARIADALVGTLEQCQRSVGLLRAAGMRELRVRLPSTSDLADVIAQISSLQGESLAKLQPGSPPSPAPAAPAGWGGRP
jgi:hypothetical protein